MFQEGQTATNPKTGQKVVFKGGQWVNLASQASSVANPQAPGAAYFAGGTRSPQLSPADNKFLTEQRTSAQNAQSMRADANRFVELNQQERTGGLQNLPVVRNVLAMVNPRVGEMMSISDKLAPAMRQAGSGAMSDKDVEMYRSSTVGVGKLGKTNQAIGGAINAGSRRQSDYSAFLEEWAKRNGGLIGAQEAWDSYAEANPLFEAGPSGTAVRQTTPWRQWFGLNGSAPGRVAGPAPQAPQAQGQGWKVLGVE